MSYEFLIESFYIGYYGYFNLNPNLNLNNNPKPITKQLKHQTTKQPNH